MADLNELDEQIKELVRKRAELVNGHKNGNNNTWVQINGDNLNGDKNTTNNQIMSYMCATEHGNPYIIRSNERARFIDGPYYVPNEWKPFINPKEEKDIKIREKSDDYDGRPYKMMTKMRIKEHGMQHLTRMAVPEHGRPFSKETMLNEPPLKYDPNNWNEPTTLNRPNFSSNDWFVSPTIVPDEVNEID